MDLPAQENQNLQPQIQRASPKVISWSKVIVTIVVIVVTTAILGAIYYFFILDKLDFNPPETIRTTTPSAQPATTSAQKDETVNWKVYTNSNDAYEIKYPPNFKFRETTYLKDPNKRDFVTESPEFVINKEGSKSIIKGGQLSITADAYSNKLNTLAKIIDLEKSTNNNLDLQFTTENIKLDGHEAVRIKYEKSVWAKRSGPEVPEDIVEEQVISVKNGRDYVITMIYANKDKEILKIFDQILSTFKFL